MPSKRWLVWIVFTLLWTVGLVMPIPLPDAAADPGVRNWPRFLFAKVLHAVAYAAWTMLTGSLRTSVPRRLLLLFFLMSHATATEIAQTFTDSREGCLRDVAIDHAGVLLGLFVSWSAWTHLKSTADVGR